MIKRVAGEKQEKTLHSKKEQKKIKNEKVRNEDMIQEVF